MCSTLCSTLTSSTAVAVSMATARPASGGAAWSRIDTTAGMVELATRNAVAVGAGHSFFVFLRDGYPVNVLNQLKRLCCVDSDVVVCQPTCGRGRSFAYGRIDDFFRQSAATIVSSTATVAAASIEYATTSARDSRVYSSTTCRIFNVRPVEVRSNW
jgi:hypothetical protein